jgi:glycosyltransferase involved in cell wall biosynthesis
LTVKRVTVAIPVLNGGSGLDETLAAVASQRIDAELELLVCDSGSTDGSVAVARAHGASVIEIPQREFSHGGTRNLLMERAQGDHVAFLTQDATPAGDAWLSSLVAGFELAADVGLVFGPYRPRPGSSPMVARELTAWFESFSADGRPRVDVLAPDGRMIPARSLLGQLGFFTDANGCVARRAWRQVPFRDVPYAEDRLLAQEMLRAGFAKVYVPDAAVVHSHDYSNWQWLRRSFDEARAVREIYGWAEPLHPRSTALNVWGRVGADLRWARAEPANRLTLPQALTILSRSTLHHAARTAGGLLGARSERLPPVLVARLSLEHRRA